MGLSEAQFEILKQNQRRALGLDVATLKALLPKVPKQKRRGVMNKTETAYAEWLGMRMICGEILGFQFEKRRFELAPGAFFTPDFDILECDGSHTYVDTKAYFRNQKRVHVEEAAMVRIKVAADKYPEHRWCHAWRDETGEWKHRYFGVKR